MHIEDQLFQRRAAGALEQAVRDHAVGAQANEAFTPSIESTDWEEWMNRRKRLTFWGAHEDDDSLARSVIEGRKTVTADTVEEYYKPYGEYGDGGYAPGDIIEVYDPRHRLRCIIHATKVLVIRFGDVPEEVWRGEAFSSAEEFREVHRRCLPHLDLHDDFEFVTLHFELVEVVAP